MNGRVRQLAETGRGAVRARSDTVLTTRPVLADEYGVTHATVQIEPASHEEDILACGCAPAVS